MMTPRLQMKAPCTYDLDCAKSIDAPSYMTGSGIMNGIEAAWVSCVKEMYDSFAASFAANEGIEAIIRDLSPSRRRLTVNRISGRNYSIECAQGARLFLTANNDDSIILSFERQTDNEGESLDLGYYDSNEAAGFICNAFRTYRKMQEDFQREASGHRKYRKLI